MLPGQDRDPHAWWNRQLSVYSKAEGISSGSTDTALVYSTNIQLWTHPIYCTSYFLFRSVFFRYRALNAQLRKSKMIQFCQCVVTTRGSWLYTVSTLTSKHYVVKWWLQGLKILSFHCLWRELADLEEKKAPNAIKILRNYRKGLRGTILTPFGGS